MSDRPMTPAEQARDYDRHWERHLWPGGPRSLESQARAEERYERMSSDPALAKNAADSLNAAAHMRNYAQNFDRGPDRDIVLDAAKEHVDQARKTRMASTSATPNASVQTASEQAADYERVNGAFDRARAQEVRQHGPGGYRGDPGESAAERRAERQGDATMQRLDPPAANAAAAEIAKDLANARVERVLARYDKAHADEHKDKALQHLADARDAMARQNSASDYWTAKIAAAPAQSSGGQDETQRAEARRGVAAKV